MLERKEAELAVKQNRTPVLVEATICQPHLPLRAAQKKLIESSSGILLLQETPGSSLAGILTLHDILRAAQAASEQGQA
jgi:CBS domain-containing protein